MGQSSVLVTGLVSVSADSGLESSSSSTIYDIIFMILMVDSHPKSFAESCMQNNKITDYDFGCKTQRNYINIITTKTKYSRHSKH